MKFTRQPEDKMDSGQQRATASFLLAALSVCLAIMLASGYQGEPGKPYRPVCGIIGRRILGDMVDVLEAGFNGCVAACERNIDCLAINHCKPNTCELVKEDLPASPVRYEAADGCFAAYVKPKCEIKTTEIYEYQYLSSAIDLSRFVFQVKAHNDVHIGLSPQPADVRGMYEIVIGGWTNSKSVIRRCKQCADLVFYNEDVLVSAEEFRGFWISYDVMTGRVAVGKQGNQAPFMEWVDPNPIPAKYVGFSTGWGSTGTFRYPCPI